MGAKSAFLGYRGYPGAVCISIDSEVVHGIPGARRIEIGQIVSLDVGVIYDGFVGDTATTVMVGVTDPEVIRLVRATELALMAGVEMARAGKRLGDLSHAIEMVAVNAGFSVVRDFVGHGVGRKMHEDPQIPNYGNPGKGPKLKVGMTLAIEPMVNMGESAVEVLSDKWTVRTVDRKPSAHFEHTVAIGDEGPEILTVV
jgi:methionyl aminopeptidase